MDHQNGRIADSPQNLLGSLSLASARLARNENRLVSTASTHLVIRKSSRTVHVGGWGIGGVHVGGVVFDLAVVVDAREPLERIHCDQDRANMSVDFILQEALSDVVKDRTFRKSVEVNKII